MSSPLHEIRRREANTYAGKLQLNYERTLAMTDVYGVAYLSMHWGMALSRVEFARRTA